MKRLKELFLNELIDLDDYRRDYTALKEQVAALQVPARKAVDLTPLRAFLNVPLDDVYEEMTPEDKRALWSSIIKRIIVKDMRHISITFF